MKIAEDVVLHMPALHLTPSHLNKFSYLTRIVLSNKNERIQFVF
jgi:hypothetical protein